MEGRKCRLKKKMGKKDANGVAFVDVFKQSPEVHHEYLTLS